MLLTVDDKQYSVFAESSGNRGTYSQWVRTWVIETKYLRPEIWGSSGYQFRKGYFTQIENDIYSPDLSVYMAERGYENDIKRLCEAIRAHAGQIHANSTRK